MILFYWLKLQEISIEVNRIGETFDMKMNAKKTNTMLVSKKYVTLTKVSLTTDGDIIKQTDNYTSKGKCDDEILKQNWNCKRYIQFDVENYNCKTHKYVK